MRFLAIVATALVAGGLHAETPAAPRQSPDFTLHFLDGSEKPLSSFQGSVCAVEFLYTTCPHCQHASQVFSKLYQEYGAKGFQPIGVAFNDMPRMLVPDFIKNFNVAYPVAISERMPVLEYLGISAMERFVVPQIVWIDRKGMIRSQTPSLGEEKLLQESTWREMIETLLKEPAVTSSKKPVNSPGARKPAS